MVLDFDNILTPDILHGFNLILQSLDFVLFVEVWHSKLFDRIKLVLIFVPYFEYFTKGSFSDQLFIFPLIFRKNEVLRKVFDQT